MSKTVTIPDTLLKKFSKASEAFHSFEDDLEEYLLTSDPKFIDKMRRARKEHISGKTRALKELIAELCTK